MRFSAVRLQGFRNILSMDVAINKQCVVFCGPNGSGKTSVLEALFYLVHARSFRTSTLKQLLHYSEDGCVVSLDCLIDGRKVVAGIERLAIGRQRMRFDGEELKSVAPIARALPIIFLDTDAHRHFAESPQNRRRFLDWGVFHVEHSYGQDWQHYQKALKQRNALLRRAGLSEADVWVEQIIAIGERLHQARLDYLSAFESLFKAIWAELISDLGVPVLKYNPGWCGGSLAESLHAAKETDRRLGFTTKGPHRADLQVIVDGRDICDFFSQGQQKSAMYAMKVAQGAFLRSSKNKQVVYLIDDLPAELDHLRLSAVLEILQKHASQIFITAIDKAHMKNIISPDDVQFFSLQSGCVI